MLTANDEKKIKKIVDSAISDPVYEKKIKKIVDSAISDPVYEKKIRLIVNVAVENGTEGIRASLVNIEKDRKVLKDIWEFVKTHSHQLKVLETRVADLESPQKVS